jgi:hypothetical protein
MEKRNEKLLDQFDNFEVKLRQILGKLEEISAEIQRQRNKIFEEIKRKLSRVESRR